MKRYIPQGMYEMYECEEGDNFGGWVDADIAEELYNSLKELVEEIDRIEGLGLNSQWTHSPMRERSRNILKRAEEDS